MSKAEAVSEMIAALDKVLAFLVRVEAAGKEVPAPEPRFYWQQPVLVSNDDGYSWSQASFSGMTRSNRFRATTAMHPGVHEWYMCKPDHTSKTIPNWWKHDGGAESPFDGDVFVNVLFTSPGGVQHEAMKARDVPWQSVDRYTIVPIPDFMA